MQIPKEEMKEAILKSGVTHFYDKGFEMASLRQIVKEAGTTIGNFYNYFESKEALFYAITTPAYEALIKFIHTHEETGQQHPIKGVDLPFIRRALTNFFQDISSIFNKELVILIDGSKGTKYENIKIAIIKEFSEHLLSHMQQAPKETTEEQENLAYALGSSFLEGMLQLLRSNVTLVQRKGLIIEYILFYITGAMAMFSS